MGKSLIDNIYLEHDKKELENFVKECNKIKIKTPLNDEYKIGLITSHFEKNYNHFYLKNVYELNFLHFSYEEDRDLFYMINERKDDNFVSFVGLGKKFKVKDDISKLSQLIRDLENEASVLFDTCYSLLSKVRTVDNLFSHWSDSYKYIPDGLEIEEPQKLSLTEKFALL